MFPVEIANPKCSNSTSKVFGRCHNSASIISHSYLSSVQFHNPWKIKNIYVIIFLEEVNMCKGIKDMSLSELSFIVITDHYSSDLKLKAEQEIRERFKNNACDYNCFMHYEKNTISQRGNKIENYLIQPNPDGQLLMELYFNYIYEQSIYQHHNLLFSEVLLCNDNSQRTFFVKALKIELNRLKKRLQTLSNDSIEYQQLSLIYQILNTRYHKKQPFWYENSLTDCVMDILSDESSFMGEERKEKLHQYIEGWKNRSKTALVKGLLFELVFYNPYLSCLNTYRIANQDIAKLSQQRKSIITSLKKGDDVDYSFVKKISH